MELKNTRQLARLSDMAPYTTAVMRYIDTHNLPSYAYPEVYDFFVTQLNLPILEDDLVFDYGDNFENCSLSDYNELYQKLNELHDEKQLFWQRKNAGLAEAGRKVREAEHQYTVQSEFFNEAKENLVIAQQELKDLMDQLDQIKE
jgi:hypothetical protein